MQWPPLARREGKLLMTGVPQREGKLMMTAGKPVMKKGRAFTPLHRAFCLKVHQLLILCLRLRLQAIGDLPLDENLRGYTEP